MAGPSGPFEMGRVMDYRIIRELAPMSLSSGDEVRLELVEFGGTRWLSLTSWTRDDDRWVKLPGTVKFPLSLLGELHNRLSAAAM